MSCNTPFVLQASPACEMTCVLQQLNSTGTLQEVNKQGSLLFLHNKIARRPSACSGTSLVSYSSCHCLSAIRQLDCSTLLSAAQASFLHNAHQTHAYWAGACAHLINIDLDRLHGGAVDILQQPFKVLHGTGCIPTEQHTNTRPSASGTVRAT